MSDRECPPYGLKSLLECVSRAVLLAQPADIPGFLSKYLEEMIRFRGGEEARDTKEVVFDFKEQWERAVFQKSLTTPEEPPSPLSSESIKPPASYRVSPPHGESQKMPRVSSVRLPPINNRVGLTHGEISPSAQRRVPVTLPPLPRMERGTTSRTKASLPSAVVVLPPIQVPLKLAQGQKPTTGCDGGFTCCLKDCCYHDRPKVGECACDSKLPKLRRTKNLEWKRSLAAPAKPDTQVPYRPKRGFMADRELDPVRTGARPVTNLPRPTSLNGGDTKRTSGAESRFLHCRQDTAYSRHGADMSLQYSVHTAGSVHIVRYTYMRVQGGKLPPLSACSPLQPNWSKDWRGSGNGSPNDPLRRSSAMSRSPSSRQSSWKQF